MVDLSQFEMLSFDCYGTLIDWEAGILGYLGPVLRTQGCRVEDSQILNLYSEIEPREQAKPYRIYREVLASVVHSVASQFGLAVSEAEANGLADSIRDWCPFPDTVPSLARLTSRYKLAVLSNIDDDLFALTAKKLEVPFDLVVTAQQVGAYKPSKRNFEILLQRAAISPRHLLHVAESLYHDVAPARELGITTVWVDRRQGRAAAATKLVDAKPDLTVRTVGELADLVFLNPVKQ